MISELENKLEYKFNNIKNLEIALTHSSYSNEHKSKFESYERYEFLGDSILGLVTSDYIFKNFKSYPEGDLTKLRASLVCEKTLCKFSKELNIGKYIKLSHGEQHTGGNNRTSILADVFEAIVAAIYIDSNLEESSKFILKFIIKEINNIDSKRFKDYKTKLQEIIQKNPEEFIEYELVNEEGPDHYKSFTMQIKINNNIISQGKGHSKKEAEQEAAKLALALMGY